MPGRLTGGMRAAAARYQGASARFEDALRAQVTLIANRTRAVGQAGMVIGVYGTPSGAYQRTNHYQESFYCVPLQVGHALGLEVGNTAEYASLIEFGLLGEHITEEQARALAEALGDAAVPLGLGRSAAQYLKPNPTVTRAAAYARLTLQKASGQVLAQVLEAHGQTT